MVLDTNILIYASKPGGEQLQPWLENPDVVISVVSRIEVLGYPGISEVEFTALEGALMSLPEIGLTEAVVKRAISIRQQRKMGLADAVIAATALVQKMPLVTRNTQDFKHVADLQLINPFDAAKLR